MVEGKLQLELIEMLKKLEATQQKLATCNQKIDQTIEGPQKDDESVSEKLDRVLAQAEKLKEQTQKLEEQEQSMMSFHCKLDELGANQWKQKEIVSSAHDKLYKQEDSMMSFHYKLDAIEKMLFSVDGKLGEQIKTTDTAADKKWCESVDSKLEAQRGIVHDVRRKLDEVRSFGGMIARIEDAQKAYSDQLEEQKRASQAVIDALTAQLEAVNQLAKAREEEILRLRKELEAK